jgi:hypothetical protein
MKSFLPIGCVLLGLSTLLYDGHSIAIAATPNIKLVVPESPVAYGDMIVVQAVVDKASLPADLVDYKHQWVVLDNSTGKKKFIMVWPDGTQAFFAAGMEPKKFTVILDTDCIFAPKTSDTIQKPWLEQPEVLVSVITVGEGPPPDPEPAPTPALPNGQFGLVKFSYNALASDTFMSQSDKVKVGDALSMSFGEVAARIAALSTMKDIEKEILPTIKQKNDEALTKSGVSKTLTQEFKKKLGDQIYSLYTSKKLATADDFAMAFREISQGLGAFK